jgi:hypothetical protein
VTLSTVTRASLDLRRVLKRLRRLRGRTAGRILFTRAPLSAELTLTLRALTVLALFAIVLVVFYLDRGGLKDAADGFV